MQERRKREMKRLPFHLDVLVETEEGNCVAYCLQLDIVATGATEEKAVSDLLDLIRAQFDFAIQNLSLIHI